MNYIQIAIIASLICTLVGGVVMGAPGALAAFFTVGIIAGTLYLCQISVVEADKHRPKR